MVIEKEIVTYRQVIEGYRVEKDPYNLGAYTLKGPIKKTFLENPCLNDFSKCMIFFDRADGMICGRQMFYPTSIKIDHDVFDAQSGSSLETEESFRQYAVGMDMINYPIKDKQYPFVIYGGVSKMIKPIYKALKFHIFESPLLWIPLNSKFFFQYYGLKGMILSILTTLTNIALWPIKNVLRCYSGVKKKGYQINELAEIPEWVDDIINEDKHKYAEYHDRKWMQWTLNNNFFARKFEKQSFYEIRKDGRPLGFFMTKIRNASFEEHHIEQVIFGSVYEWGIFQDSLLSEFDIYTFAISTLLGNVDIIEMSSNDTMTIKRLRRIFAFPHGNTTFVVRDMTKSYKDIGDITKWRVRLGYCDVPFY